MNDRLIERTEGTEFTNEGTEGTKTNEETNSFMPPFVSISSFLRCALRSLRHLQFISFPQRLASVIQSRAETARDRQCLTIAREKHPAAVRAQS